MKTVPNAALLLIFVSTGWMVSFWFTRSQAIARWEEDNPVWLGNVSDQIIQNEETFCQWVEKTTQTLQQQQIEMSRLMEDPDSENETIFAQSDLITGTHAELLRGIGQHLKSMRSNLPDCQKQLLTGFCSQSMQGSMRRMGRRFQAPDQMQNGYAGFPGQGNGYGWGRRQGRCGLIRRLQLTEKQISISEQKDPAFETEVSLLQTQLVSERQKLLSLLEDPQALNGQVPEQIERLITAHNQLEKRLINYVVIMRPYLSAEQKQNLTSMCKNNCSEI